jgi:hypothetical protein
MSKAVTCYLLPVTCYLLPVTCYLLPVTCYLLPVTCYLPCVIDGIGEEWRAEFPC